MAGALVALADFKSVAARPSALGGFDSHTFPPVQANPPRVPAGMHRKAKGADARNRLLDWRGRH